MNFWWICPVFFFLKIDYLPFFEHMAWLILFAASDIHSRLELEINTMSIRVG